VGATSPTVGPWMSEGRFVADFADAECDRIDRAQY
jgi:hypothetical protein